MILIEARQDTTGWYWLCVALGDCPDRFHSSSEALTGGYLSAIVDHGWQERDIITQLGHHGGL